LVIHNRKKTGAAFRKKILPFVFGALGIGGGIYHNSDNSNSSSTENNLKKQIPDLEVTVDYQKGKVPELFPDKSFKSQFGFTLDTNFKENTLAQELYRKAQHKSEDFFIKDYEMLQEIIKIVKLRTPNFETDATQFEKDLLYFNTLINEKDIKKMLNIISENLLFETTSLSMRFKEYFQNLQSGVSNEYDFYTNLSKEQSSLNGKIITGEEIGLDLSEFNNSLSSWLYQLAAQYDVNPRLVLIICVIENNLGNIGRSSSRAYGYTQTKPSTLMGHFPDMDYNELKKDKEKLLRYHLLTTFEELRDIHEKYNLNIGFKDDTYKNEQDLYMAGAIYYRGTKKMNYLNGYIYEDSENGNYAKKYVGYMVSALNQYQYFLVRPQRNSDKKIIVK
jgi:hypothetical protein